MINLSKNLSPQEKAMLFERAAMLIRNGMAVIEIMDGLAQEFKKKGPDLLKIKPRILNGDSFVDCLKDIKILSTSEYSLLKACEIAGKLPQGLLQVSNFIEFVQNQRSIAKKAIIPNILKIAAAVSVLYCMLLFIVPATAQNTSERNQEKFMVFAMMKWVKNFNEHYALYSLLLLCGLIAGGMVYLSDNKRKERFYNFIINFLLSIPKVKQPLLYFYLAIWARQGSMMIESGITFKEFIDLTDKSFPSSIQKTVKTILYDVERSSWTRALNIKYWKKDDPRQAWPMEFFGALRAGGETGLLEKTLSTLSDSLEKRSSRLLTKISDIFGLFAFLLAAGTVGFVMYSVMSASLAGMSR